MGYPVSGKYHVQSDMISNIRVVAPNNPPNSYIQYDVTDKSKNVYRVTRLICPYQDFWAHLRTYGAGDDGSWGRSVYSTEKISRGLQKYPDPGTNYYASLVSRVLIQAAPPAVPSVNPNAALIAQSKILEAEKMTLKNQLDLLAKKIAELQKEKIQQGIDITRLNQELEKLNRALL